MGRQSKRLPALHVFKSELATSCIFSDATAIPAAPAAKGTCWLQKHIVQYFFCNHEANDKQADSLAVGAAKQLVFLRGAFLCV